MPRRLSPTPLRVTDGKPPYGGLIEETVITVDATHRKWGWELRSESAPSLCKHYLPVGDEDHEMTVFCRCKPALQGEPTLNPPYTIVHHNVI